MALRQLRYVLLALAAGLVLAACSPPEERAAEYLAKAQQFFDAGDYPRAQLEAKNAAQVEPRNARARYLLALIAEKNEKPRDMLGHLLVAVDVDPAMWEARVKLGTLYLFGQAYEEAAAQAKAALELAPDAADPHLLQAQVLLQQGDREGALREVGEALAREPDNAVALAFEANVHAPVDPEKALALLDAGFARVPPADAKLMHEVKLMILEQQNRPAEVEQELKTLAEAMPEVGSYRIRLARLYTAQGRKDEAEKILRGMAATETDAKDTGGRLALITFLGRQRSPQAVEEALKGFIENEPDNQRLQIALGKFYDEQGRREDSVATLEKAIAMDPRSEQGLAGRNRLATQRLRDGDVKGANEYLQGILADAPDDKDALLMRAGLLFADGQYQDAVAALRGVLRREPDNQNALLLLARVHERNGDMALARDAYRRLLDVNPNHPDAAREYLNAAAGSGALAEAEKVLRQLAEANSQNVELSALLTEALVMRGDLGTAETEARRLVSGEDPTGIGAYQLGQVLEGQRRFADATAAYAQALGKSPDDALMLQGLVRSLAAQGKQAEAIAELRRRVQTDPKAVNVRLALGAALGREGKTKEAASVLEALLADQPRMVGAWVAMAELYPATSDEHLAALRRGLQALPGNAQLGFRLGAAYQGLRRVDDAMALYEEVLAANPQLEWPANDLASTLLEYRYQDPASLKRAVQMAEKLANSKDPGVMDTVGWAYYRSGKAKEAVPYLEQAAAALGELPDVQFHLGMAYLATGQPEKGRPLLEQALATGGDDLAGAAEARQALAKL